MRKLGILIPNLGVNQLAFMAVYQANKLLAERYDTNIMFFCQNSGPHVLPPSCTVMQMAEAHCFDGTLLATSVGTAKIALKLPGPKRILYYVWDLEWIRPRPVYYNDILPAFIDPKMDLIARNADHAAIIKNCFNRDPIGVADDFDMSSILYWAA